MLAILRREIIFATALIGGIGFFTSASAHPAPYGPQGAAHASTQPMAEADQANDPLAIFRAPLLREGSHVVEVNARFSRGDAATAAGPWKLIIESGSQDKPAHELIVLPCTRLAEMQRIAASLPDQPAIFRVTGEVFVYRDRNYVLPRHAPVVMTQQAPPAGADSSESASPAPPDDPASRPDDDSAADIIKQLEDSAGPTMRSGASGAGSSSASSGSPIGAPVQVLREETGLASRRGRFTRDSSGGWVFIFDADASGLSDPPVTILPCLLLERIEGYVQRQGNNAPALLSGTVYLYEGRNYLLPTVFHIPQDRRNLTP
jgi:hypothetical protein